MEDIGIWRAAEQTRKLYGADAAASEPLLPSIARMKLTPYPRITTCSYVPGLAPR